MTPALVLLAAGASTRLGRCKALVELTPENPLELLSAAARALDSAPPLVISGAHHDAIAAALPAGLELAVNRRWPEGMLSSIALAHELRPGRDLCLAPVDVPLVPRAAFDRLLARWRHAGSPPRGWLAPAVLVENASGASELRHGHPVIVGRELLDRIATLPPGATPRALRALADPLLALELPFPEVLDDLDTPADLERLRRRRTD